LAVFGFNSNITSYVPQGSPSPKVPPDYWQIRDAEDRYKNVKEFEKGIEQGKIEVARRLIDKGMSLEEAAEVAGVSAEVFRGGY
jgi:hypothetical protein